MLKLLKSFKHNLDKRDNFELAPADRAYSNHAYDTARYLMLEEGQNVSSDLALKVKSPGMIKIMIRQ